MLYCLWSLPMTRSLKPGSTYPSFSEFRILSVSAIYAGCFYHQSFLPFSLLLLSLRCTDVWARACMFLRRTHLLRCVQPQTTETSGGAGGLLSQSYILTRGDSSTVLREKLADKTSSKANRRNSALLPHTSQQHQVTILFTYRPEDSNKGRQHAWHSCQSLSTNATFWRARSSVTAPEILRRQTVLLFWVY